MSCPSGHVPLGSTYVYTGRDLVRVGAAGVCSSENPLSDTELAQLIPQKLASNPGSGITLKALLKPGFLFPAAFSRLKPVATGRRARYQIWTASDGYAMGLMHA